MPFFKRFVILLPLFFSFFLSTELQLQSSCSVLLILFIAEDFFFLKLIFCCDLFISCFFREPVVLVKFIFDPVTPVIPVKYKVKLHKVFHSCYHRMSLL